MQDYKRKVDNIMKEVKNEKTIVLRDITAKSFL